MIVKQTHKRKALAEGPASYGVGRFKQEEPTVSTSITGFDTKGEIIHTFVQMTVTELRAIVAFTEDNEIVKTWDRETDPKKALDHWREQRDKKTKHRYTVEQQVDKTWAIFNGGGFVRGGYLTKDAATFEANVRITADREAGVPVEMGVG